MKKYIVISLLLLSYFNLISQNKEYSLTIDFNEINKEVISGMNYTPKGLDFDFRIIDSLYFEQNSRKSELTSFDGDKLNFELKTWDFKTISFKCRNSIPEKCVTYIGYSERVESHLINRCSEVCVSFLMDARNGDVIFLPEIFNGGSFTEFTSNYMIVWGSTDDYGKQYYDGIQSYLEVYQILSSDKPLKERFKYVGHLKSKYWSIYELYLTDNQDTFVMKISESENEFNYIEITLN